MSDKLVIPGAGELEDVFQGAGEQKVLATSAYLATEDFAPGDC